MRARLLKPSDYPVMPWKNGSGVTRQLLIEPEGARLDSPFRWRLSLAEVGSDGPASAFPGYQRTLVLLEGNGLALEFGSNGGKHLEKPFDTVTFAGDWPTHFHLIDGPCKDFNVMTTQGLQHKVTLLRPDPRAIVSASHTTILFCARGKAAVAPTGVTIAHDETLRLDEATGAIEISSLANDTVLVAVSIWEDSVQSDTK